MLRLKKNRLFPAKLKNHLFARKTREKLINVISLPPLKKRRRGWLWFYLLRITLFLVALLFLGLFFTFAWYSKDLPGPEKILSRGIPESTKIYDRNGNLLYEAYGEEKRTLLKPEEVPEIIKKATIAAEDKDFYHHHGISFSGILRALYTNITHRKVTQGGSTITQQYVKNSIPEVGRKRTLSRKIKELILTLELEWLYSKDQILTMYLNQIPYGNTAYGIESASKTYFNKSVKDGLTLDEAALLVALPQAPTYYNPWGSHTKELLERRNWVIDRMVALKMVSKEEGEKAKETDTLAKLGKRRENITAPHFVMYIKEYLAEKYGEETVLEGGLKVTTTLDLNVQKMAEEVIANEFPKIQKATKARNAAFVAIDPKTGQILAMIGSVDFFDLKNDGNVNVATSLRQPGSSFKPIVYAAAFQDKYNPAFVLFDLPTDFGGGYIPSNYDNIPRGPVTMRQALANSLNISAVKTISLVGVENAIKLAKELGITTLNRPASFYGPPLVLGSGEVKLLDLVSAYAVFANEGVRQPVTGILKVTNQKGEVLEEYKPKSLPVLDKAVAFLISDILSDNEARAAVFGRNSKLHIPGYTVAVKTGTTSDYRDAWTIGYTKSITAGVWVGNNDNTALVHGSAGAMAAAPLWNAFMTRYLAGKPDEPFTPPDNVEKITVDKFSNKLPSKNSPPDERVTDWFAPWHKPKDYDNIHIVVKVCKTDGKLAPDGAPPELVEERYFVNIHSEKPDDPNWERPVQEWAKAHLNTSEPPKEYCDLSASATPSVSISQPKEGEEISGIYQFLASVNSSFPITKVDFLIDDKNVGSVNEPPYGLYFDLNTLSSGTHTITVMANNQQGGSGSASVHFLVKASAPPTLEVLKIANIAIETSPSSATISFTTTPAASGSVEYGETSDLGKSVAYPEAIEHRVNLSGLSGGKIYYYRINASKENMKASSPINSFYLP